MELIQAGVVEGVLDCNVVALGKRAEAVDAGGYSDMGLLIGRRFEEHFKIARPNHADMGSVLDRLRDRIFKSKYFHG